MVVFENNIVVVVVVFKVVAIFVVVPKSFSSFHSLKVLMAKRVLSKIQKGTTRQSTFRLGFKVLLFRVYSLHRHLKS